MTGRQDFLKNLIPTAPYSVELPNRMEIVVKQQGNVTLSLNFVIHKVLFIPSLNVDERKTVLYYND